MCVLDLLQLRSHPDDCVWTRKALQVFPPEHSKHSSESSLVPIEIKTSIGLQCKGDPVIKVHPLESFRTHLFDEK